MPKDATPRDLGGFFVNVGAWAPSPESAARLARERAMAPDPGTGWSPPGGSTIGDCEVDETMPPEGTPPDFPQVASTSGRAFYPRKRWWQFWR